MAMALSEQVLSQNRMERVKADRHPLDVLADLERYAREGWEAIPADDLERLKWYGLFHRNKAPGTFMLRVRVPGGILGAHQLRALSDLAERVGGGRADITTRQNVQLRWITIDQAPGVLAALYAAGLTAMQTGMDNVRNVVGCPLAGLDGEELLDATPVVREITRRIVGSRAHANLPRKFNISVTGCREDCGHSLVSDVGLTPAVRVAGGAPRLGFNVAVGGSLGAQHRALALDLDAWVPPEEAADACLAVVEVFRDHGPREARQRVRLRFLLDDWGLDRFRAAVEERLGRPLERAGYQGFLHRRREHLGVHRQKQPGLFWVGLHVPVGRLEARQLRELARLAEEYGSGEVRLTNDQNVLLVNVPQARVFALLKEPLLKELLPDPPSLRRGVVACTGTEECCNFAVIATKGNALRLGEVLEAELGPDLPLRIHWSGCPNSCGQHEIADIGLEGTRARADGELVEAVNVYWGGRYSPDGRLGELVAERVPVAELAGFLLKRLRAEREAASVPAGTGAPPAGLAAAAGASEPAAAEGGR